MMKKKVVVFRRMTTPAIGRHWRVPLFSSPGRLQQFSFVGAESLEMQKNSFLL